MFEQLFKQNMWITVMENEGKIRDVIVVESDTTRSVYLWFNIYTESVQNDFDSLDSDSDSRIFLFMLQLKYDILIATYDSLNTLR